MGSESRQITILKEVVELLDVPSGKPAGLTIHRYRERPIWHDDLPAIVVYAAPSREGIEETVEHDRMAGASSAKVRRTLTFRTEIRVEIDPDTEPASDTLDPLYVWAVNQLAPVGSVTGVLRGPHETRSTSDVSVEGEKQVALKVVEWEIEYRTQRTDPTEA